MTLSLEIEGLSIPMSGGGDGSSNYYTSDTSGGGGGVSLGVEACDTCDGEGGSGGGRLMGNTSGLGGGVGRKWSMGRHPLMHVEMN